MSSSVNPASTIATRSGLPGLRGTEHIGFTVPNLDEATDFFVNVIGCELMFELGRRGMLSSGLRKRMLNR